MPRRLLPFSAALAACAPSPQEAAMSRPTTVPGTDARISSQQMLLDDGSTAVQSTGRDAKRPEPAAQGPIMEPVSAAENRALAMLADSPAEAIGRRTLSTAFVMVGPDGHLTVELHDGRVLVLRDVVMRPEDYCGAEVSGGSGKARYCGGYADVVAARPGGAS